MTNAGKLALVLLCQCSAMAQSRTISARAGTINNQQGGVFVDDKRVYATYGLAPPLQIKNGQQLRVNNGRVELLLGSGVYLRMLGASSIRMQENQLADTRVLIEEGSAAIELAGMTKGARLRVICGESTTELKRDGLYRFDTPGKLRIYSGEVTMENAGTVVKVRNGQAVDLAGALEFSRFDLKETDALQAWAVQRIQRRNDGERRRLQARAMAAVKSKAQIDDREREAHAWKSLP